MRAICLKPGKGLQTAALFFARVAQAFEKELVLPQAKKTPSKAVVRAGDEAFTILPKVEKQMRNTVERVGSHGNEEATKAAPSSAKSDPAKGFASRVAILSSSRKGRSPCPGSPNSPDQRRPVLEYAP